MRSMMVLYKVLYPQGLVQCHGSEIYVCQKTDNTHIIKKQTNKKPLPKLDPDYCQSMVGFSHAHMML